MFNYLPVMDLPNMGRDHQACDVGQRFFLSFMVAFYDGKEGSPEFSGPQHWADDTTVCATGFDSFGNLFMFVENGAKNSHSEISWCLEKFRTGPPKLICWNARISFR